MSDINQLQHFGVKGMRWGVRRKSNYNSSTQSEDHAQSRTSDKNGELTDKQKIALRIFVGATITASIVGGSYGAKNILMLKAIN